MRRPIFLIYLLILVSLVFTSAASAASLSRQEAGYQTGFVRWRGADSGFSGWALSGTRIDRKGSMILDPGKAITGSDLYPAGGYYGGNYFNGGSFIVGEAVSPEVYPSFAYKEAIASWNADTPNGTWVEIQIRAQFGSRWSKWYSLGIWASSTETVQRHSVSLQGDADGYVATDTLVLSDKKVSASAFQLKARLFSADGKTIPTIHNLSVAYSTTPPAKVEGVSTGNPENWITLPDVPLCSQMVYPNGGNVWCSPTSTSMVLGYWGFMPGPCAPRVAATVEGVYDWIYDGHGNWPFNTAFAAAQGYEGYVVRYTSLAQLEPWIAAGVPVVMSIAWGKKDLSYAPVTSSAGHLIVLVGFEKNGDAIVNDPAAPADGASVRRTYLRSELEPLWLQNSGGTVYLIFPTALAVPEL